MYTLMSGKNTTKSLRKIIPQNTISYTIRGSPYS